MSSPKLESAPLAGRTVLVLIGSHLATAPRPQKEARALREAGARVFVRGTWWNDALAEEDRSLARALDIEFAPVVDLRSGRDRIVRIRQRVAREAFTRLRLVTPRAFGVGAPELLREARRIRADLTMVHSEAGLWVGKRLLRDGLRVGVDFEDWFSRDLPANLRSGRPVDALAAHERHLLRHARPCFATTRAMAEALAADAHSPVPTAIPNSFAADARTAARGGTRDPRIANGVSFHWFSQTIGPGRGLETLGRALATLRGEWELTLRGNLHNRKAWFDETFPAGVRARIRIADLVPNDELLARTMSHDVGLALEEPYCDSRDLTATNKIFEYLRAGLAVIATRTRGQEEVMRECPDAGVLVPPDDPSALAQSMQRFIEHPDLLPGPRAAAVRAAEGAWAWENFRDRLVSEIATAAALSMSR